MSTATPAKPTKYALPVWVLQLLVIVVYLFIIGVLAAVVYQLLNSDRVAEQTAATSSDSAPSPPKSDSTAWTGMLARQQMANAAVQILAGFGIGSTLVLCGLWFCIHELQAPIELRVKTESFRLGIVTASTGLVLCIAGATLIGFTLNSTVLRVKLPGGAEIYGEAGGLEPAKPQK